MDSALRQVRFLMAFGALFVVAALVWGLKYRFNHVWGHWIMGILMIAFGLWVLISGARREDQLLEEAERQACAMPSTPTLREPERGGDQVSRIDDGVYIGTTRIWVPPLASRESEADRDQVSRIDDSDLG